MRIPTEIATSEMPEDYYDKWESLLTYERRATRKATRTKSPKDWEARQRAHNRLTEHENAHSRPCRAPRGEYTV